VKASLYDPKMGFSTAPAPTAGLLHHQVNFFCGELQVFTKYSLLFFSFPVLFISLSGNLRNQRLNETANNVPCKP
jgi:hypothetical protein